MIDVHDIEVIGLAGSTLVECGTAIPVARRLSDGKFCRFVVSPAPLQWFPGSEFDQLVSEGRVSPLESPVPLPSSAVAANPVQPLVLYMNQVFLAAAETTPPADWEEKQCVWTLLPHESVKTWAACLPGEQAKAMLNEMAEKILDRLDAGISCTRNAEETARLLQLADFGLCAATDKTLRWRLYLRYGATLEPDRVRRTFDSFVVREFPSCRWESYLKEMTSFQSVLISRAPDFATTTFLEVASEVSTLNHDAEPLFEAGVSTKTMRPTGAGLAGVLSVHSRKTNERIIIDENIMITVLEIRDGRVRIGIEAPRAIHSLREDISRPIPDQMLNLSPDLSE